MRYRLAILLLSAGCAGSITPDPITPTVIGHLEDVRIDEASGLARSQREPGLLWVHNDRGNEPRLFAIDAGGASRGDLRVASLDNDDWEDFDSLLDGDIPYLVIAAIGDNDAQRELRSFYFIREPDAVRDGRVTVERRIDFRYPDGPRDAESAAFDLENRRALVLSKRDIPPRLYAVPLDAGDAPVAATLLGEVSGLPQPSAKDIEAAPAALDWWWQPVGMDIAPDNRAAVLLTYRGVYYFERMNGADWYDVLNGKPKVALLGDFPNAEAVAFAGDGHSVIVTGENPNSAVLRIDFGGDRL